MYIRQDTVLFCLAQDESDLQDLGISDEELDWRQVFEKNQRFTDAGTDRREFLRTVAKKSANVSLEGLGIGTFPMNHRDSLRSGDGRLLDSPERVHDDHKATGAQESWDSPGRPRSLHFRRPSAEEDHGGLLPLILDRVGGRDLRSIEEDEASFNDDHLMQERNKRMVPMGSSSSFFDDSVEEISSNELVKLNEYARNIMENAEEAPFVLLIDQAKSWQTVMPFLAQSRRDYMPFTMPIIVLSESPPSPSVTSTLTFEGDGLTGAVIGSSNKATDLLAAGVRQCSIIVCLGQDASCSTQPSREMVAMLDADVLMLHRMLSRLGLSDKAMIFEFKRTANMRLLPQLETPSSLSLRTLRDEVASADPRVARGFFMGDGDEGYSATEMQRPWHRRLVDFFKCLCCCCWSLTSEAVGTRYSRADTEARASTTSKEEVSATRDDVAWYLDPRFAAGEVFSPHFLGALMAHAFYTPGVLEVMQALLIPSDGEDAFLPWQIHLSQEYIGGTYGFLFREMVSHPAHPVLPLGLLRMTEGGIKPYVVTNPAGDTRLLETDLLFVLGDRRFGEAAYADGSLPLSGNTGGGRQRWTLAWDGTGAEASTGQAAGRRWIR